MGGLLPRSNAKRKQTMSIEILKDTLSKIRILPKRDFESSQEFKAYFEKHKKLIFNATEQRVQQSKDNKTQKEYYSGKKMSYSKSNGYSE